MHVWIRRMKLPLFPWQRRAASIKSHSRRLKALARSNLRMKAFWFQLFELKEWIISWVIIILEEICFFLIKAAWARLMEQERSGLSLSVKDFAMIL
jgi:hypothetical protein